MDNFKNSLQDRSHSELEVLLNNYENLTSEAKNHLYDFLSDKKELHNDKFYFLEQELEENNPNTKSLKYLKNLGFAYEDSDLGIQIKRSRSAKSTDILGSIVGAILMLGLLGSVGVIFQVIEQGWSIPSGISLVIFLLIGSIGFAVFYRCMNRFLEYKGFEISKTNSGLIVKKQGVTTVDSILSDNSLDFKREGDKSMIFLRESNVPLIVSKTNPHFSDTVEYLFERLN